VFCVSPDLHLDPIELSLNCHAVSAFRWRSVSAEFVCSSYRRSVKFPSSLGLELLARHILPYKSLTYSKARKATRVQCEFLSTYAPSGELPLVVRQVFQG
jgi:hypothetical protein